MEKIKVIELFAGMGAVHTALSRLNIDYEMVDVVEFDKKVIEAYNLIHGTNYEAQDVTKWDKDVKCDYLHASTPCQAFSVAGKCEGANDSKGRGIPLWEATVRIIKKTEPKFITLENVKGLLSPKHQELVNWYVSQLDQLGYYTEYKVLNAKDFGVPQNRERVFFVSWKKELNFNMDWYFGDFPISCIKDIQDSEAKWFSPKEVVFLNNNELIFKNEMPQYNGHIIKLNIEKALRGKTGKIVKCAEIQKQMWDETVANVYDMRSRIYNNNNNNSPTLDTLESDIPKTIELSNNGLYEIKTRINNNNNNNSPVINTISDLVPKIVECNSINFTQAKTFNNNNNNNSGALDCSHGRSVFENKICELNSIPFREDNAYNNNNNNSNTLLSQNCDFKSKICDLDFNQMKSYNNNNNITGTLRAGDCNICEKVLQIEEGIIRYRALTPRECFRLMDFSDEQFDKVKHFSLSRLTHLAGNSIVVKCVEEILRKVFNQWKY